MSATGIAEGGEQTPRVAAAMVLTSAACFATMPTFAKLAYASGADTVGVLLVRFALASVLVLGAVRLLRGPLRIGARSPAQMLLLIGLFSAQSFCFFASVEENTAVRAVLLLYTYPLITTLAAAALFGEPLSPRKLALLGLGFSGVVLSVGTLSASFTALGLLLGIGSAVLFASFMLAAKSSLLAHGAALEMMGIVYAGAGVVYVGIALAGGAAMPGDGGGWWALAAVIGIGTLAAMGLFFAGLNHLPAGIAAMLSTLEPALSVLFAAAVLGETISLRQGLGILIVLGSLYALGRMIGARQQPATAPIAP